eukprot:SAG31_NODE_576_length_13956_cov_10.311828_1_plen_182_part_00
MGGIAGRCLGDDAGGSDERVRQCRLAVVDVGDHGHGPNVGHLVLNFLELGDGKVHLSSTAATSRSAAHTYKRFGRRRMPDVAPALPSLYVVWTGLGRGGVKGKGGAGRCEGQKRGGVKGKGGAGRGGAGKLTMLAGGVVCQSCGCGVFWGAQRDGGAWRPDRAWGGQAAAAGRICRLCNVI